MAQSLSSVEVEEQHSSVETGGEKQIAGWVYVHARVGDDCSGERVVRGKDVVVQRPQHDSRPAIAASDETFSRAALNETDSVDVSPRRFANLRQASRVGAEEEQLRTALVAPSFSRVSDICRACGGRPARVSLRAGAQREHNGRAILGPVCACDLPEAPRLRLCVLAPFAGPPTVDHLRHPEASYELLRQPDLARSSSLRPCCHCVSCLEI